MVSKRKILVITRWFPNPAEPVKCVFTKNIVDAQSESKKYSFVVISPIPYFPHIKIPLFKKYAKFSDVPLVEKRENYKVYRPKYLKLPYPYLLIFEWYPYFLQVLKTIKEKNIKFDLIHCHGIYPDGLVGVKIGKHFNKKVVLHIHESYLNADKKLNLYKKILTSVNWLIPVSNSQLNRISKVHNRLIEKCKVIYNGVKIDKKLTPLENPEQSDRKIIKLVFIGHLIYIKGLDVLLKALAYLGDYEFSLDIIGNGRSLKEYRRLAKRRSLDDKVSFLGEIDNDNLLKRLAEYDYLVLPSRYETFGVVLIEAMSRGLPVISTRVGPIPEIVTSEEVGILVEPENPESLAEGLKRAFSKNWDRAYIRKYTEKFSIERTVEKIERVYDELTVS